MKTNKIKEKDNKSSYKHPFETLAYNKGFVNGKKKTTADFIKWLEEFSLGIPSLTPQKIELNNKIKELKQELK